MFSRVNGRMKFSKVIIWEIFLLHNRSYVSQKIAKTFALLLSTISPWFSYLFRHSCCNIFWESVYSCQTCLIIKISHAKIISLNINYFWNWVIGHFCILMIWVAFGKTLTNIEFSLQESFSYNHAISPHDPYPLVCWDSLTGRNLLCMILII